MKRITAASIAMVMLSAFVTMGAVAFAQVASPTTSPAASPDATTTTTTPDGAPATGLGGAN